MQYQQTHKFKSKEPAGSSASKDPQLAFDKLIDKHFHLDGIQPAKPVHEREASSQKETARRRILEKIDSQDLPGKAHLIHYIRFQFRKNYKPSTVYSSHLTISQFLISLKDTSTTSLENLSRSDIESFFEQQQDRGLKASTLRTHLNCLYAFIRFLVDEGVIGAELLSRKISIKPPDSLRRNISDEDIEKLLSVIEDQRNRAMIMLLLRTGMRIGELLKTRMTDVSLEEQTIRIYESEKTGSGRVVYFSNDAAEALYEWLLVRDYWKERLFYAQGRTSMKYGAARAVFVKYITKAGLEDKGYTLHCLRHTFATNLLNARMPIEVLRDLLGHSNLAQTQHYAKLVDRIREEEFFKAMAMIEGEDNHELD